MDIPILFLNFDISIPNTDICINDLTHKQIQKTMVCKNIFISVLNTYICIRSTDKYRYLYN